LRGSSSSQQGGGVSAAVRSEPTSLQASIRAGAAAATAKQPSVSARQESNWGPDRGEQGGRVQTQLSGVAAAASQSGAARGVLSGGGGSLTGSRRQQEAVLAKAAQLLAEEDSD
jgi:hypothetical protein